MQTGGPGGPPARQKCVRGTTDTTTTGSHKLSTSSPRPCLPLFFQLVRECSQCGEKHTGSGLCRKCKRSNDRIADRQKRLVRDAVDVPDPSPARRLRRSLSRCRADGHPFDVAWSIATEDALRNAEDGWGSVLKWSEHEWRAAYEGRPNGTKGNFALLEPLSAA
jgi:hypothetical protein